MKIGKIPGAVVATIVLASLLVVGSNSGVVGAVADQPLSATASSMWQTNNTVYALAAKSGVVYAGGSFTAVRPPGAAEGTNETTRTYLAAFNASTGALITGFNVSLNGQVRALALSPDGNSLYIGGQFTTVGGQTRQRIAKVNATTGALDTAFQANASATVTALDATSSSVYLGGDFNTVKSTSRTRLAKVSASSGNVDTSFNAPVDGRVLSIKSAPNGSRVIIAGAFDNVNNALQGAVASLNPTTGATMPWAATGIVPRPAQGGCSSNGEGLIVVGDVAYVTAEALEPGCWEGILAANISDGSVRWVQNCVGAGQALAAIGQWLYKASHLHDCGPNEGRSAFVGPKSFAEFVWYRLNAWSTVDGTAGHWHPNTNGAGLEVVGPHALATDGTQLFVGGDFTTVNGTAQRGITRFTPTGANSTPTTPEAPSAVATSAGTVTVTVPATHDREDGTLTYSLYRDGGSTPIATATMESWIWTKPTWRFTDTGLAPGSSHTYRVRASDGSANSSQSPVSNTVTVAGSNPAAFDSVVNSASPSAFWRLDGSVSPGADSSGNGVGVVAEGGVTPNQPGVISGNSAVLLDGSTGYLRSSTPLTVGTGFSQSVWVNTTTGRGGDLLGLSDSPTGNGTLNDRVLWMDGNGQVAWGLRTSATRFAMVRSRNSINDGRWHQVTLTFDGAQLLLYVDGVVTSNGLLNNPLTTTPPSPGSMYLRAGFADLTFFYSVFGRNFNGNKAPVSHSFAGYLDEVAFYPNALSPAQIQAQYAAGIAQSTGGPPPTTTTTSTTTTSTSTTTSSTTTTTTGSSSNVVAIAAGSSWRYLDNGSNQGTAWRAEGFADGAWSSGASELGYGDGDEATVVSFGPSSSSKYITTYFRKTFDVADASKVTAAALGLVRDDGAVVYVNGTEVMRSNMPTGTIGSSTVASSNVSGSGSSAWNAATVSPSLLHNGTNTIAVEVHQRSASSSDISFNLSLNLTISGT